MRMLSVLLLVPFLASCGGGVCALIGDYAGTFSGDAEGNLTLTIVEGDGDEPAVSLSLQSDLFTAIGEGSLDCSTGELALTLTDEAGNTMGEFSGSMDDQSGEWSLDSGESGTWSMDAVE